MNDNFSEEVKAGALKIAKGTQRPGQTKEQTKLVAQGIEKGIAEYRKQEKAKARERDKQRKKQARAKVVEQTPSEDTEPGHLNSGLVPWILLVISWIGFAIFHFWQ